MFSLSARPSEARPRCNEYLRRHPGIYMSPEKEPAYFCPDLHKQRRSEEEYLQLFAEADKKLFDITVVTFYPGGYFAGDISHSGIPVISLDKSGRWDLVRFFWRLKNEVRRIKPDIIYSVLVEPNLVTRS